MVERAISDARIRHVYQVYYTNQRWSATAVAEKLEVSATTFRRRCAELGLEMRECQQAAAARQANLRRVERYYCCGSKGELKRCWCGLGERLA